LSQPIDARSEQNGSVIRLDSAVRNPFFQIRAEVLDERTFAGTAGSLMGADNDQAILYSEICGTRSSTKIIGRGETSCGEQPWQRRWS
jgi:hypothetical protein